MKRVKLHHQIIGPFFLMLCWGVGGSPARTREVKLAIRPAGLTAQTAENSLLPKPGSLIEADAVPLYREASQALPGDTDRKVIQKWLDLAPQQLPVAEAEAYLERHIEALRKVAKAARCKQCNWPAWKPGAPIDEDMEFLKLAFVTALWARLETARGQHDGSLLAIQTGFGMARHLGQAPTIIQTLIGGAVVSLMCAELEQFVQCRGAPNLYEAWAALPRPLVDAEQAIANELRAHGQDPVDESIRDQVT